MAAKFLAKGTLILNREPKRAVIYGDVLEGTVRIGMFVRIPLNTSLSMVSEIEGVEFLDKRSEGESYVALVLKPEEDANEETGLLEDLNVGDELLEITESA